MKKNPKNRREGDFLRYYLSVQDALRGYILSAVRDHHTADDLLQTVSIALWENFDRYDEQYPFRAWAFGFAKNRILRWRREQKKSREVLSPALLERMAEVASDVSEGVEVRRKCLRQCLEQLNGSARRIVTLRYRETRRLKEIAELLGKEVGTVQVAISRIRTKLRMCVEEKMSQQQEVYAGP